MSCPGILQVCIEVTLQNQFAPSGPPSDGRDNVLYDRGVFGGGVKPHDMPPLTSCRAIEVYCIQGEVPHIVVEERDATIMRDQRLRCRNPIPARFPCVNPPRDLCILEDAKVNIHLRYTAQRGLKSPVPYVANII